MTKSSSVYERVKEVANYFIENDTTVRETAKYFGVSKTTIHKDLTNRLPRVNPELSKKATGILQKNKAECHIRGGNSTKEKYLLMKKNSCNSNGGDSVE